MTTRPFPTGSLLLLIAVAGCATTQASAEERAACARMESSMGLHTTHDHQQMKGTGGSAMNLTHERCQRILAAEN